MPHSCTSYEHPCPAPCRCCSPSFAPVLSLGLPPSLQRWLWGRGWAGPSSQVPGRGLRAQAGLWSSQPVGESLSLLEPHPRHRRGRPSNSHLAGLRSAGWHTVGLREGGLCRGVCFALTVTSGAGPGWGCEPLPVGVVALNSVCLEPCGNNGEAQPDPQSPVPAHLPVEGEEGACYLSLGGHHVAGPGRPTGTQRGPQASWPLFPGQTHKGEGREPTIPCISFCSQTLILIPLGVSTRPTL